MKTYKLGHGRCCRSVMGRCNDATWCHPLASDAEEPRHVVTCSRTRQLHRLAHLRLAAPVYDLNERCGTRWSPSNSPYPDSCAKSGATRVQYHKMVECPVPTHIGAVRAPVDVLRQCRSIWVAQKPSTHLIESPSARAQLRRLRQGTGPTKTIIYVMKM